MPTLGPIVWLILALIAAGSVLGSLYALAMSFERERATHDLMVKVASLRRDYAQRLSDLQARQAERY